MTYVAPEHHLSFHIVKGKAVIVKIRKMTGTITVPAIPLSYLIFISMIVLYPDVCGCARNRVRRFSTVYVICCINKRLVECIRQPISYIVSS